MKIEWILIYQKKGGHRTKYRPSHLNICHIKFGSLIANVLVQCIFNDITKNNLCSIEEDVYCPLIWFPVPYCPVFPFIVTTG